MCTARCCNGPGELDASDSLGGEDWRRVGCAALYQESCHLEPQGHGRYDMLALVRGVGVVHVDVGVGAVVFVVVLVLVLVLMLVLVVRLLLI